MKENVEGLVPPQNLDAEEAILGGILLDPGAIERVCDIIQSDAFYINAHSQIYRATLSLHAEGKPTDLISVTTWLHDNEKLDKVGGQSFLAQLVARTVSTVNIDLLAGLVNDKYQSRQLIKVGNEIKQLGYENSIPIADRVDEAEQKIFAISQEQERSEPESLNEICPAIFFEIERFTTLGTKPGLDTPFYDLNSLTGGLSPGLLVVAARPSMGKSSLAAQLAYEMAEMHQMPSLIFSLEMSKMDVTDRFLSAKSGIELTRFRSRQIASEEMEVVVAAISEISESPVFIDDTPCPTPASIRSKVRRMIARHGKLCLVVIDYLQLMVGVGSEDNEVREVGNITRYLKLLSKECEVPIALLSQLNRNVESRQNKRPQLADLRASGRIEEDADLVLFLYRDEYYNTDSPDKGIAEVIIQKNRNGATGTAKLLFDAPHCWFRNLAGSAPR